MAQSLENRVNALEKKLNTVALDAKPAATIEGSTPPLAASTFPPGDIEQRLQKLEKKSETIVVAFPAVGPPIILPENIPAKRNDKVLWQFVRDPDVDLKKVIIEFAPEAKYFDGPTKNRREIIIGPGPNIIQGKVRGDHPTGIDKYTIRWQIADKPMAFIDPTIIVTDP